MYFHFYLIKQNDTDENNSKKTDWHWESEMYKMHICIICIYDNVEHEYRWNFVAQYDVQLLWMSFGLECMRYVVFICIHVFMNKKELIIFEVKYDTCSFDIFIKCSLSTLLVCSILKWTSENFQRIAISFSILWSKIIGYFCFAGNE